MEEGWKLFGRRGRSTVQCKIKSKKSILLRELGVVVGGRLLLSSLTLGGRHRNI